jgi:hypothetical protein
MLLSLLALIAVRWRLSSRISSQETSVLLISSQIVIVDEAES